MARRRRRRYRKNPPSLLPLLIGGGILAYFLFFRKKAPTEPGVTVAAEIPVIEPKLVYKDLAGLVQKFDDVKTMYRMGRLSPEQALEETQFLQSNLTALRDRNIITETERSDVAPDLNIFIADVKSFMGTV